MAYGAQQQRIIAREVARAGGNLSAAVKRLRSEYESFREIGVSTIRRYLEERDFKALVKEQSQILAKASNDAAVKVEQERAVREALPGLLGKLQREDQMLEDLRKEIETKLDAGDLDTKEVLRLFQQLTQISDRRQRDALPAIGSTADAEALVLAVAEVLGAELGAETTARLMAAIRERYHARRG